MLGRGSTDQLCSPAGFLAFLWFVAFCFLANQWQRTTLTRGFSQGADAARAAITFSFFSIIIWVSAAPELRGESRNETCLGPALSWRGSLGFGEVNPGGQRGAVLGKPAGPPHVELVVSYPGRISSVPSCWGIPGFPFSQGWEVLFPLKMCHQSRAALISGPC